MERFHMQKHLLACAILIAASCSVSAQLILNEANAVGNTEPYIEDGGTTKPYEGFDYGVLPYSGNTNSPIDPNEPGNPFPDVDAVAPGVQDELPNGWKAETGWARILENGGDWIELVVTEDFTDLRGYWLYWENDDDQDNIPGEAGEWGFVRLSYDPAWMNLRAGTIITISEDPVRAEIRDRYPDIPGDPPSAPVIHDTGHIYDLGTNLGFDPIGVGVPTAPEDDGDWHIHFWLNESITQNQGMDTQYFLADSNIKVDNDDWVHWIFDSTNPGPSPGGDLTTGLVQDIVGEDAPDWGDDTGGGGVNNQEVIALNADPVSGISASWYEDIDFSTFGRPNLFNAAVESTLDGVQGFSTVRAWLPNVKIGDSNYDDCVDFVDVSVTLSNLTGPENAIDLPWSQGSFDGDGDADIVDISLLQINIDC
jgi:hypothetical protein